MSTHDVVMTVDMLEELIVTCFFERFVEDAPDYCWGFTDECAEA